MEPIIKQIPPVLWTHLLNRDYDEPESVIVLVWLLYTKCGDVGVCLKPMKVQNVTECDRM